MGKQRLTFADNRMRISKHLNRDAFFRFARLEFTIL